MSFYSSPFFKEASEKLRAFIGFNSAVDGRLMTVAFFKEIYDAAAGACVFILCTVDHRRNTGIDDAACAHGTWLKSDKHGAVG